MDTNANSPSRGTATTAVWQAKCKDCEQERRLQEGRGVTKETGFEYSGSWATRSLDRGGSRSDRCPRHRKAHRDAIRSIAVPYIDLEVIGQVPNARSPSGPLGGLGPLPIVHNKKELENSLEPFGFGMSDSDILQLLEGLERKQVAVVEAGTGTGKSTFMPFRLMNSPDAARINLCDYGPIIVTEPRRAAATGVSRFVGESLCFGYDSANCGGHFGPGYPVGYQVSGEKFWDSACELIYVTDGTMINWVRDGKLANIGAVIVDEAHERSENIDIILAQLREMLPVYPHLKVIITSATLDKDFFTAYFGGVDRVHHQLIPEIKSFGYGTPLFLDLEIDDTVIANGYPGNLEVVKEATEGQIEFSGWEKEGPPNESGFSENLYETTKILQALRTGSEIKLEEWKAKMPAALAKQVLAIAEGTSVGDILGFLPTKDAIFSAVGDIKEGLESRGLDFDVYPLLSTVSKEVSQKAIAARSPGDKRKIVVSSNLAETSLTVPGVRYVVDSGLICQPEWDPEIVNASYPSKPHSQSGLRQRWGRVGRDAPGWVFPLYTLQQFDHLPKNTPPGSTQKNLESFYLKLVSSGMDLESAILPANFEHPSVQYDQEDRNNASVFTRESARVEQALKASGCVDEAGDLTQFGRDLERYPGDGAEALAMMLSEQLCCAHEVAIALHVLGNGVLIGHTNDCILQISRDWPSAWRVVAARRHRALVVGCEDDLDILLRIVHARLVAESSELWCRQWWVNGKAVDAAIEAMMESVEKLSAGMKGAAERDPIVKLGGRARRVLSRAFPGLRYRRRGEDTYVSENEEELEVLLGRIRLVDPGDTIIAFNRFRPGSRSPEEGPALPIVSHTIRVSGESTENSDDLDLLGFQLVLQSAADKKANVTWEQNIEHVRNLFPVGGIIEYGMRLEGGKHTEKSIELKTGPTLRPQSLIERASSGSGNRSGFDREWDINSTSGSELPDEEISRQLVDLSVIDADDFEGSEGNSSKIDEFVKSTPHSDRLALDIESYHDDESLPKEGVALVSGYSVSDSGRISLRVQSVGEEAVYDELSLHDDLNVGDQIGLLVGWREYDHESEFIELLREDGKGAFYINVEKFPRNRECLGFHKYDVDFLDCFVKDSSLQALVIRQNEVGKTISLREKLIEHLQSLNQVNLKIGGQRKQLFEAVVREEMNEWGKVSVAVEGDTDLDSFLPCRFDVPAYMFERAGVENVAVQTPILVELGIDTTDKKCRLEPEVSEAFELAKKYSNELDIDGKYLRCDKEVLPLSAFRSLLELDNDPAWHIRVCEFYLQSSFWKVRAVYKKRFSSQVDLSPVICKLISGQAESLRTRFRCDIWVENGSTLKLSGFEEDLNLLKSEIEALNDSYYIVVKIPANTIGRVIGKHQANINALKGIRDIVDVQYDDGKNLVYVFGTSVRSAKQVVEDIHWLVGDMVGQLTLPPGKSGALIGSKGKNIAMLTSASGCRASERGRTGVWDIQGRDKEAVLKFFQLTESVVSGGSFELVKLGRVGIEEQKLKKTRTKAASDGSVPKSRKPSNDSVAAIVRQTKSRVMRTTGDEGSVRTRKSPVQPQSVKNEQKADVSMFRTVVLPVLVIVVILVAISLLF